jgi:hypothetical protein
MWKVGIRFPAGHDFSLRHNIKTGSEVHPPSYPMGTSSFWGGKAAGVHNSRPSTAEVKNTWNYISYMVGVFFILRRFSSN